MALKDALNPKNEPVLITALVGAVLSFLVTHGVISTTQASSFTQYGVVVATLALGFLARRFVKPLNKLASDVGVDLTGNSHVTELFTELGLDPNGDPLPVTSLGAAVTAEPPVGIAPTAAPAADPSGVPPGALAP